VNARPLDPLTLELSPNRDRSRFLVIGQTPEHRERSFYLHAMRNLRPISRELFDSFRTTFVIADNNRIVGRFTSIRRARWFQRLWNSTTSRLLCVLPKK
jgi:hypothetical protein